MEDNFKTVKRNFEAVKNGMPLRNLPKDELWDVLDFAEENGFKFADRDDCLTILNSCVGSNCFVLDDFFTEECRNAELCTIAVKKSTSPALTMTHVPEEVIDASKELQQMCIDLAKGGEHWHHMLFKFTDAFKERHPEICRAAVRAHGIRDVIDVIPNSVLTLMYLDGMPLRSLPLYKRELAIMRSFQIGFEFTDYEDCLIIVNHPVVKKLGIALACIAKECRSAEICEIALRNSEKPYSTMCYIPEEVFDASAKIQQIFKEVAESDMRDCMFCFLSDGFKERHPKLFQL